MQVLYSHMIASLQLEPRTNANVTKHPFLAVQDWAWELDKSNLIGCPYCSCSLALYLGFSLLSPFCDPIKCILTLCYLAWSSKQNSGLATCGCPYNLHSMALVWRRATWSSVLFLSVPYLISISSLFHANPIQSSTLADPKKIPIRLISEYPPLNLSS